MTDILCRGLKSLIMALRAYVMFTVTEDKPIYCVIQMVLRVVQQFSVNLVHCTVFRYQQC